jgi:hypothetical protein
VCSLGFCHSRHRGAEEVIVDKSALSLLACIEGLGSFALVQWNRIHLIEELEKFVSS